MAASSHVGKGLAFEKDRKLSLKHHQESIQRDDKHAKEHLKSKKEHQKEIQKLSKKGGLAIGERPMSKAQQKKYEKLETSS